MLVSYRSTLLLSVVMFATCVTDLDGNYPICLQNSGVNCETPLHLVYLKRWTAHMEIVVIIDTLLL